jgi:hypothetical protein
MHVPDLIAGTKLKFYIGFEKGQVIVDFGTNVSHMEMEPEEAEKIAAMLIKHAGNARRGRILADVVQKPVHQASGSRE